MTTRMNLLSLCTFICTVITFSAIAGTAQAISVLDLDFQTGYSTGNLAGQNGWGGGGDGNVVDIGGGNLVVQGQTSGAAGVRNSSILGPIPANTEQLIIEATMNIRDSNDTDRGNLIRIVDTNSFYLFDFGTNFNSSADFRVISGAGNFFGTLADGNALDGTYTDYDVRMTLDFTGANVLMDMDVKRDGQATFSKVFDDENLAVGTQAGVDHTDPSTWSGLGFRIIQTGYVDNIVVTANIAAAATPEPSTLLLAALGIVGLATTRRRRRS